MRRLLAIAVLLAVAAPAWGQAKKLYDPTSRMQFYITVGPSDPNVVVGASPVIRLVKNGGADANSASTFTSGGGGYYSSSTLDSNDYNTPGPLSGWVVGYPWIHFTTWVGTPLDANIGNMQATLAKTADVRAKDANLGGLQNELGSAGTTGVAYWLNNIQAIPNLLSLAIDNAGKVSVIGTDLTWTSADAASRVASGAWGKGLLADANATRTRAALLATLANLVSAESNIVHHWDSNWATAGSGGGGTGLTAQQTRDALDLTATAGGASIDVQLAALDANGLAYTRGEALRVDANSNTRGTAIDGNLAAWIGTRLATSGYTSPTGASVTEGGSYWSSTVQQTAPMAWWRLADATNQIDANQILTSHGTPTYGTSLVTGDRNKSATLNGSTGYFSSIDPNLSLRGPLSVVAVIASTDAVNTMRFVSHRGNYESNSFDLCITTGCVSWFCGGPAGSGQVQGSIPIADGNPHLVVSTIDANGHLVLWIDGIQDAVSATLCVPLPLGIPQGNEFDIGRMPDVGQNLTGTIDEVALYDRCLIESEVAALQNARSLSVPAPPLTHDQGWDAQLIWYGDSHLTATHGGYAISQISAHGRYHSALNFSVGGYLEPNIISGVPTVVAPYVDANRRHKVFATNIGTNDFGTRMLPLVPGRSLAQMQGDANTILKLARQAGCDTVIFGTALPRKDVAYTYDPNFFITLETARVAWNAWLLATGPQWGFYVCDVGSNPLFADPNNAVIFQQDTCVHLSTAGYVLYGAIWAQTVDAAVSLSAPTVQSAGKALLANAATVESNIVHHWDSNWATAGSGGGGTGLTAQQTRDALDLAATAGGISIDTQLAALAGSTGTGVNSVWPKVMDANGVALQGARITAKQGVTTISNLTDANGVGQGMSLDSLTFVWTVAKDGYSFTPVSRVIPGDANFYMTQVTIAGATVAGTCNVALDVYGGDGNTIGAGCVVSFIQTTTPAGGAYAGAAVTATTNGSGRATKTLWQGCKYDVSVGSSTIKIIVPSASTYLVPNGFVWKP